MTKYFCKKNQRKCIFVIFRYHFAAFDRLDTSDYSKK